MKLLMLAYGGRNPQRITSLPDRLHATGFSELQLHLAMLPLETFIRTSDDHV